jgi:hypothetical protein
MNKQPTVELVFTAAEVAAFAGVDESALRGHEPDGFGSPGHWRMHGGQVIYTLAGARLLAQAISLSGNEEGAAALLNGVNKAEEAEIRPPAPGIPAVRKNDDAPWFRAGAME